MEPGLSQPPERDTSNCCSAGISCFFSNRNMTCEIVDIIDFTERRLARRIEVTAGIINLPIVMCFSAVLYLNGYSPTLMLGILFLLIPGLYLHEGSHYILQWLFSHKKPHIGFKFPFPYSALSSGCSITRNQAIICALAPLVLVTIALVVPALFVALLPKIIFLAWASIEVPTCYGDLYLIRRLLKHPNDVRLKNVNLRNVLFRN